MSEAQPHRALDRPDALSALMCSARGLLALRALPGVGPKTVLRTMVTQNYDVLLSERAEEWARALADADRQLSWCDAHGIAALSFFDQHYPVRLRAIHEPPSVLFVHGSVDVVNSLRSIAVVGTREPTSFGTSATDVLVQALARTRWTIVSGLAHGIDAVAHGAALKYDTPTIGVMAGGLDHIYPKQNRELAAAIVDRGGALVSEQPIGMRPSAGTFVARNRIQSALSAAVMVMQTGLRGGTMHTARHAVAQGRPIYCPVPHTRNPRNEGLRALLQEPGSMLCQTLPAWRSAGDLCRRLGSWPVAHPFEKGNLNRVLGELEATLPAAPTTSEPLASPLAPGASPASPGALAPIGSAPALWAERPIEDRLSLFAPGEP